MSINDQFKHLFKPEVQHSANELIRKKLVYLQIGSDTQIDASIRGTTPVKVALRSESIASSDILVDCTCKSAQKGSLCKHIWAVLELAAERSPDFFEMKTDLQRSPLLSQTKVKTQSPAQTNFKQKQADYRKQAYQTQKLRAKDRKSEKTSTFSQSLPDEVKAALKFFELNGFPMTVPVDDVTVNNAKRVLSRVFHPDKGGAHEEMLELLRHANALIEFRL